MPVVTAYRLLHHVPNPVLKERAMRLGGERQSQNVEDMRGRGGGLRLGGTVG